MYINFIPGGTFTLHSVNTVFIFYIKMGWIGTEMVTSQELHFLTHT